MPINIDVIDTKNIIFGQITLKSVKQMTFSGGKRPDPDKIWYQIEL